MAERFQPSLPPDLSLSSKILVGATAAFVVVLVASSVRETGVGSITSLIAVVVLAAGAAGFVSLGFDVRRREAPLRRSEESYRILFERNVVGVALTDGYGTCIESNAAFVDMFGFSDPREVEGVRLGDLLDATGSRDVEFPGPGGVREVRTEDRHGSPLWVLACWGAVSEANGEDGNILLTTVDVTDHVTDRERLAAVVDTVEEGIVTVGSDGRVSFCNSAAARMFGFRSDELRTVGALEGAAALSAPDGTPMSWEEFAGKRALREGEAVRGQVVRITRDDESTLGLRIDAVPVAQGAEGAEQVVLTLRDVTAELEESDALRESERRHRNVVDHVAQVIFQTDSDGRFTFLNSTWEDFTGVPVADALGEALLHHVHPDDRDAFRRELDAVLAGRLVHSRQEIRFAAGGESEPKWAEVLMRGLEGTGEEGRESGTAGTLTDITQRHRSEERLTRARRLQAMGQLAGGVAHDFNNLLTVLMGHAQLIEMEARDRESVPETITDAVDEIFRTSRRAADLTRQLLTFSRHQILSRVRFDVNDVIERYEHLVHRVLPVSIRCELRLSPDLPEVEMSPTHLEQAILNLVINARDALEGVSGGTLTVRSRAVEVDESARGWGPDLAPGRYVAIEVEDSGRGMPREVIPRIFEPFYTTKGEEGGTGMGLATVYGIVSQAGGSVDVESEPGKGSTFTIYLPEAGPEPPVGRPPAAEEVPGLPSP